MATDHDLSLAKGGWISVYLEEVQARALKSSESEVFSVRWESDVDGALAGAIGVTEDKEAAVIAREGEVAGIE